ncbi:DUF3231 family protein [Bacillus sp. 31A1R]|uniref:DUF3231 family protein n=1 Tax=Robertmurraya mangrovi TaxID=3098077 RepID=A0ABU5ITP2_9BACI|nr:DUF3231 family protein [Bacillus sp. 31A1R]MDZ5470491.1 DUF3231 family protein [Bacillus sp. 31A1R]
MELHHHPKLTSAEIANLWSTYLNDTAIICLLTHFSKHTEDLDIETIVKKTLDIAIDHVEKVGKILEKEKIPLPKGYPVKEHVNLDAPKLYTDIFYSDFIYNACRFALVSHVQALNLSARNDITELFRSFYQDTSSLLIEIIEVMKGKGIFIRPPYIPYPEERDFVDKQNFLVGWLGKRRPLLAIEATNLFDQAISNQLGKELLTGFIQVTKDKEIKDYLIRGRKLSTDIVHTVQVVLEDELIPNGMKWDSKVTKSTEPPFSEQLMLFTTSALNAIGLGKVGYSISMALRRDLVTSYVQISNQIMLFSEDGSNILINRGWMEQPPQVPDREKLSEER